MKNPLVVGWTTPPAPPVASDTGGSFDQFTIREVPATRPHNPPRPVPYTEFAGVGRDIGHIGQQDRYQSLAFAERLGVVGWPWTVATVRSALIQPIGQTGGRRALRNRFNVLAVPSTPTGNRGTAEGLPTQLLVQHLVGSNSPLQKIA